MMNLAVNLLILLECKTLLVLIPYSVYDKKQNDAHSQSITTPIIFITKSEFICFRRVTFDINNCFRETPPSQGRGEKSLMC